MGGLQSYFQRESYIRINLLGLKNSGKSNLFCYLENGIFEEKGPSWFPECKMMKYADLDLIVLDTGSNFPEQKKKTYGKEINDKMKYIIFYQYFLWAIFYMVDSCDCDNFENARQDLHSYFNCQYLKSVPFVIFATKQDCKDENPATSSELRKVLQLENVKQKCEIFPCNARTGEGLQEAFEWLKKRL